MTHLLRFDDLQAIFHHSIAHLPDHRKPSPNTRSTIQDAVLGAFGIFFTPSPSFLEYQRRLQHTQGRNNAQTLWGVAQIPCDHQGRTRLDPRTPSSREPVLETICKEREPHCRFDHLRVLGEHLVVALDGTTSFASKPIHCPHCLPRQRTHGHTLSDHTAITPGLVWPGRPDVIALPPASIRPQDGEATQDCAQPAGKRWRRTQAPAVAPPQMPILGDDLYRKQPLWALAQPQGLPCILTCQPDAHLKGSERWACWQAHDGMAAREGRAWNGRFTEVTMSRDVHDVLLRGGDDAVLVTWFESTVRKANTGAPLYHNSVITTHRLRADHLAAVAHAERRRWKIANDNTTVRKTKGYPLEHHVGHGQPYLSAFLLSLTLLALLCHTVLAWSDEQDALLRRVLARRQTFFADIRALTRYMVFDSWDQLMNVMIRGLDLQPQADTG
jgi:hypothetical protein